MIQFEIIKDAFEIIKEYGRVEGNKVLDGCEEIFRMEHDDIITMMIINHNTNTQYIYRGEPRQLQTTIIQSVGDVWDVDDFKDIFDKYYSLLNWAKHIDNSDEYSVIVIKES